MSNIIPNSNMDMREQPLDVESKDAQDVTLPVNNPIDENQEVKE